MAMKPVSVTQLNSYIKRVVQTDPLLGNVSVIGETSNVKYHETGHVYFTMKDAGSKINCFLPADKVRSLRYALENGMEITASGYIFIYEKGGTYSLNVRDVEVSGQGSLSIAFDKLKKKLYDEGLFDARHKKQLPKFPQSVAIVTSGSGAAVEDMLKIITARNNIVDVLVFPVLVQGKGAAQDISDAIGAINREFPKTDIIITGRGGGSIEELWAFNEEIVARSIFESAIPVISAVGHEIDVTISDFVADVRAETPTAAAQLAVPDIAELKLYAGSLKENLFEAAERYVQNKKRLLDAYNLSAFTKIFENKIDLCMAAANSLRVRLDSLNPANIMSLGYGAILDKGGILRGTASAFGPGDLLTVVFSDGRADCTVNEIRGGRNVK
ncbi:MAG: exodeoxyribonuclease VII large subunit [Clostridiales bacterium]|nr:exodeoxyribonuclease VII large subunit [Clostridiales bacterium]